MTASPTASCPAELFHELAGSGANTVLTGPAGTGKSHHVRGFLLRHQDSCQGLTLDSAFVDVRAAREPGQAYVALSRVRTLAGLHLKDWPRGIVVSQRALSFHFKQNSCP